MRRSTTCAIVAALLLGGCGTTSDTNPSAPTDQAAGRQGGQDGHHQRYHRLAILLLPPCDTIGQPPDTIPTDTIPTDTIPTDTIPTDTIPTDTIPTDTIPTDTIPTDTGGIPTLQLLMRAMGSSHQGSGGSRHSDGGLRGRDGSDHGSGRGDDSHHRHHRQHQACFDASGNGRGSHGSWSDRSDWSGGSDSSEGPDWIAGWRGLFGRATFGIIKIPVPSDGDTTVSLRTRLHQVAPNTVYRMQFAVDTIPDHVCSDSNWVTVGSGGVLESILSDSNGNARQTLTQDIPALPPSFTIDVRFRVYNAVDGNLTLVSRCNQFTTRR